jgi:hypothetical protein
LYATKLQAEKRVFAKMSGGRSLSGLSAGGSGLEADVSLLELANLVPEANKVVIGNGTSWVTETLDQIVGAVTKSYVDTQDAGLQTQISTNTADIATKAAKTYVDTQDTALQTQITANTTGIASKQDADTNLTHLSGSTPYLDKMLSVAFPDVGGYTGKVIKFYSPVESGNYNMNLEAYSVGSGVVGYRWNMANNGAYDGFLKFDRGNVIATGTVSGATPTVGTHLTTKAYVDSAVTGATPDISGKADTTYVDTQDAGLQTQITANTTAIATKAAATYVDTQDTALQTQITTNTTGISTNTTAIATKAATTYVDTQDTALQTQITTNTTAIAGKQAADTNLTHLSGSTPYLDKMLSVAFPDVGGYAGKMINFYSPVESGNYNLNLEAYSVGSGVVGYRWNMANNGAYDAFLKFDRGNVIATGTVSGATPTAGTHLTTKAYVDSAVTAATPDISGKADKTYVDAQDTALQTAITASATFITAYVDTQDAALQTQITAKQAADDNLTHLSGSTPYLDKTLGVNAPGTTSTRALNLYQPSIANGSNVCMSLGRANATYDEAQVTFNKVTNNNAQNYLKMQLNGQTKGLWIRGDGVAGADGDFNAYGNVTLAGSGILTAPGGNFTGTVSGVTPTVAAHLATKSYVDTQDATKQPLHFQLTSLSSTTPYLTNAVTGVDPTASAHLTTKSYVDNRVSNMGIPTVYTFTGTDLEYTTSAYRYIRWSNVTFARTGFAGFEITAQLFGDNSGYAAYVNINGTKVSGSDTTYHFNNGMWREITWMGTASVVAGGGNAVDLIWQTGAGCSDADVTHSLAVWSTIG